MSHSTSTIPLGYRLRVLRVNDLPLHTTFDGRTFEFQLGVSLYDEAYGTFYGNTVYRLMPCISSCNCPSVSHTFRHVISHSFLSNAA